MKGTELRQLCEDYEVIRESIDTTKEIIKRKKTVGLILIWVFMMFLSGSSDYFE